MQQQNMSVASEFLEMAARLIYIKSAELLPQNDTAEEMKRQITEELLEYRAVQNAANELRRRNTGRAIYVRTMQELPSAPYSCHHSPAELVAAHRPCAGQGTKPDAVDEVLGGRDKLARGLEVGEGEPAITIAGIAADADGVWRVRAPDRGAR
jgi:chromatin segregation and condensation protein Rec8/ScpA/Scc1 (kleisin family)